VSTPPQLPQISPTWRNLTAREWDLLLLLSFDFNTDDLKAILYIERSSIDNYKYNISTKLGLKGRGALDRYARLHGEALRIWYPILCRKLNPALMHHLGQEESGGCITRRSRQPEKQGGISCKNE
jgi:DNA-binding CsgD family transcriptional regulator